MTLEEAREKYGARTLLKKDHNDHWRPVFPQPRHNLPPNACKAQLAAFVAWRNQHIPSPTNKEKNCHAAAYPEPR